jgi:hypothetical protein
VSKDKARRNAQPQEESMNTTKLKRRARHARVGQAVLILLAVLVAGCTKQQMYRPDNVEKGPGYTLGFIEFDDQGEPWSPAQAERVIEAIERANRSPNGAIVIVFVHGWKNNASVEQERKDGYILNGFNKLLTELTRLTRAMDPTSPPEVVGVFIAWRGKSAKFLQDLSFWGRRKAARRVASPAATGTLFELLTTAQDNPRSRAALVGHSFGGLLVESVMTHAMSGILYSGVEGQAEFPADIVVLVNPAASAVLAKEFVDLLAREGVTFYRVDAKGTRYERPLIVSVTSEGDTATRVYFPIGARLGGLGKHYRTYGPEFCSPGESQREFLVHTAGNTEVLHSHIMTRQPLPPGTQVPETDVQLQLGEDPTTGEKTFSFTGFHDRYTVSKKPGALNQTPYWIMRVPKSLIPNHSDIFRPDTIRLLSALVRVTGAFAPDSRTVLVRQSIARPVYLKVLPSGDLLVIDQLRRLHTLTPGQSRPVFVACYPHAVDLGSSIGGYTDGKSALIVTNQAVPGKGKDKGQWVYQTEVFEVANVLSPAIGKPITLKGLTRYHGATADLQAKKVYLVTADMLHVAELSKKKPEPQPLASLETSAQLGRLHFDASDRRILIPDIKLGRLTVVDLRGQEPRVSVAATGLGAPTDVIAQGDTFYVTDSQGKQIWRIECPQASCAPPQVFARSDQFMTPVRLDASKDGTIWVADWGARAVFAIDPNGRIRQSISWSLKRGS